MSLQRIFRYRSPDELATSMAGRLVQRIIDLQATRDCVNLALTSGNTASSMYAAFGMLAQTPSLDPNRLTLWWSSERYVPTTDPHRNSTLALSLLARKLSLVSSNVHPMPSTTGTRDPDEAAYIYATEIGDTIFDICLLGLGRDGHVAAIYPDHHSLTVQHETSLLAIGVTDAPVPPLERVTLTLNTINRSSEVWLLATGTAKADVVARAVQHDTVLPAGLVHGAEATYWFLDAAASRRLRYHRCGL